MKHIYIFKVECRASTYGIGTYLSSLEETLKTMSDVKLTIVNISDAARVLNVNVSVANGCRLIEIPNLSKNAVYKRDYCRYENRLFYVLSQYISSSEYNVFYFSAPFNTLASLIKTHFSSTIIISVVHYLTWYFHLDGSLSRLRRLINSNKQVCDPDEQLALYEYFKDYDGLSNHIRWL